ncbi:carbohydrate-binding module family 1 protein [Aspergillus luchuensis CBS 106.47]|uniref:AA9 family lytic polysaccharide monooxygenase n=1 Tax=Aspergillus luchuensis (strain CBS 106.47) TaxID=1137211 RepID=A0A1M3TGB9_ASPLC|nr:carbohydrate-binding module family 1 protein [Aspergillus luchuensis CBS 106.47]
MKTTTYSLLALAAASKLASAHTTVQAVWINGEDQGLGNTDDGYIRSPPSNSPVTDVTSTDMTCNVNGDQAASKTLSVKAGDVVTFEWHHSDRSDSDDIIASSHKGPVQVYMAPTAKGSNGNNWVKIAEDGYHKSSDEWATDILIANKGKHNITVPDVPAGNYLFRPEIIALHEGNREGGAQFYMECVQFKVTSDGSNELPSGVSIPGVYTATDPGILFDIYNSFDSYPIPGPDVWDGSSSGSSSSGSSSAAVSSAAAATTSAVAATTPATQAAVEVSSSAAAAATTEAAAPVVSSAAPVQQATSAVTSQAQAAPTTFATSSKKSSKTACKNKTKSNSQVAAATSSVVAPAATSSVVPVVSASASASAGGVAKQYERCGGINHTGPTTCESGSVCKKWNPYYYQCVASQ